MPNNMLRIHFATLTNIGLVQRPLLVPLLVVLSLTAIAISAQPQNSQARNDVGNRKYNTASMSTTATNDVSVATAAAAAAAPRPARFVQPNGLFGFFGTLRSIKQLYDEQYNDTLVTLQKVSATVGDQFSDTGNTTKKPATNAPAAIAAGNSTGNSNSSSITTTTAKPEKYRISREELGYILGKNYRGLRKLLRLELNDAANQTRISLKEYRRDFGRALSPYVIPKMINGTTTTTTTEKSTL